MKCTNLETTMKLLCEQGPRRPLKSEGAQGGTFFRATFYCVFGRFGKLTHSVNFKKWGGGAQAPPLPLLVRGP